MLAGNIVAMLYKYSCDHGAVSCWLYRLIHCSKESLCNKNKLFFSPINFSPIRAGTGGAGEQTGGSKPVITILHFNDVYNIEDHGEKGGAARLKTVLKSYQHLNPLVIFSGDAFSPSMSKG